MRNWPLLLVVIAGLLLTMPVRAAVGECVVLLHGLARSSDSMEKMAEALSVAGYTVSNVDYPSRKYPIEILAPGAINTGVWHCQNHGARAIHFVTHSMGGILVRYYLKRNELPAMGRVVMLAPPNHGSEVVDAMKDVPGYDWLNGPAGRQLGTDDNSIPLKLGPANFEVGIIAGDRTINYFLSTLLPNPDDGKVSVQSAKLEGMTDFLVVNETHPLIMRSEEVIEETIHFLRHGQFERVQKRSDNITRPPNQPRYKQ